MIIKKWRPFWSFDVEKTESWLSELAEDGYQLNKFNRMKQLFYFKKADSKKLTYNIVYDKGQEPLTESLSKANWEAVTANGKWTIIKNEDEAIKLFPSRDGIFKRNQLLTNIFSFLSIIYSVQLLILISTFLILFVTIDGKNSFVASPLWIITIVYFIQVLAVIIFTIISQRKISTFQQKYFNSSIDIDNHDGNSFSKWILGWVDNPQKLEKRLENMAANGQSLIKISSQSGRFHFKSDLARRVAYVLDFQWKVDPSYYDIHKSAGWKLRFTSSLPFFKYSLWEKEYDLDEKKPQLTYSDVEERQRRRKLHIGNLINNSLPLLIVIYFLIIVMPTYSNSSWHLIDQVLFAAICLSALLPISRIAKVVYAMLISEK